MLCNKNGHFFIVLVYIATATTFASPVDFGRDDTDVTRHKFLSGETLKGDADIADIDTMLTKREEEVQSLDSSLLDNRYFFTLDQNCYFQWLFYHYFFHRGPSYLVQTSIGWWAPKCMLTVFKGLRKLVTFSPHQGNGIYSAPVSISSRLLTGSRVP